MIDNNIEHYRNASTSYPFFPDSEVYRDGYSQGGFRASHEFGEREENGAYASGYTYKKGDKYLSFSVDYSDK